MRVKVLVLSILLATLNSYSQNPAPTDELSKHLSAAETFQISGDLVNAAAENRIVAGIVLERLGNIAIEAGQYEKAVELLRDAASYRNNSSTHTSLAIAFLRQGKLEEAVSEAELGVALDENSTYARYILGNIFYTKGEYASALPQLEKVFIAEPSFDVARALGLTYLRLKQLERAKLLFEEMQVSLKKESADLHILFGHAFEETDYYLESELEFKKAVKINPKHPRANFYIGFVILKHAGGKRLDEAAQAFERELAVTDDFYTNFFVGVVAISQNDNVRAETYLQKAIRLNPKSSEAHLFLGQAQLDLEKLEAAEKNLRRSIEIAADTKQAVVQARRTHFLLGRLLLKLGKPDEAKKELEIARKLHLEFLDSTRSEVDRILGQVIDRLSASSDNAEKRNTVEVYEAISPERKTELGKIKNYLTDILAQSFYNLGVIAFQNQEMTEALARFNSAATWKPDFPGLDRTLGIVNFRTKNFSEAIAPLARHLKADPDDALARQLLGTSYHLTGDFRKTVEVLKPISLSLLQNPELAYFYGISMVQIEDFEGARPVFDSLAGSTQNPEALFYAGQGFMFTGDYERAVKEFVKVLQIEPKRPKANFFKGQSLIRLNRYDEAETAFREELKINPADESSKYHLALTLIERRIKTDEAVGLLQEAITTRSDYADARYQLGKIYNEAGETAKAIEQLEAAVRSDDKKDYIHYQLSIAYRKAARRDDAEKSLKTYQKLKSETRQNESPMPMGGQNN
jgi:tetratricopeptide (TPR) repeat protein